jgi:hypothetical protein
MTISPVSSICFLTFLKLSSILSTFPNKCNIGYLIFSPIPESLGEHKGFLQSWLYTGARDFFGLSPGSLCLQCPQIAPLFLGCGRGVDNIEQGMLKGSYCSNNTYAVIIKKNGFCCLFLT